MSCGCPVLKPHRLLIGLYLFLWHAFSDGQGKVEQLCHYEQTKQTLEVNAKIEQCVLQV